MLSISASTANGSGNETVNYTGTTLSEGTYAFTTTATANSKTSTETAPFLAGQGQTKTAMQESGRVINYGVSTGRLVAAFL